LKGLFILVFVCRERLYLWKGNYFSFDGGDTNWNCENNWKGEFAEV
jgi:hypothetical protein